MIFTSNYPSRIIPNVTVYEYLFENNPNMKDETKSFVDSDNPSQAITFAELKNMVLRLGAGLKKKFPDFKRGDVVAIYSPNNVSLFLLKPKEKKTYMTQKKALLSTYFTRYFCSW